MQSLHDDRTSGAPLDAAAVTSEPDHAGPSEVCSPRESSAAASSPEPGTEPAGDPQLVADQADQPYRLTQPHDMIPIDPDLNARLQAAGFTEAQAQLVYDLAAQRFLPLLVDALHEVSAHEQILLLQQHFGGPTAWREVARQVRSWAMAHLPPDAVQALAASHDGVLTLYRMMQAAEPTLLASDGGRGDGPDEAELAEMVRDPRYWRRRDPDFVARVTAGFRRLYAG